MDQEVKRGYRCFSNGLDKPLQDAIASLTKDKTFQERFGNDKVLDDLDKKVINKAECLDDFTALYSKKITINGVDYPPISMANWCFLWCKNSPLTTDEDIHEEDLDLFFYILMNDIPEKDEFKGFVKEHFNTIDEAVDVASKIISNAFKPLGMFPSSGHVEGKVQNIYDVHWAATLVASVHGITGYSPETIFDLPLNTVCHYYLAYAKMNGEKGIERFTNQEVLQLQDYRCCELIADRLIEIGALGADKRKEFIKQISTKPN